MRARGQDPTTFTSVGAALAEARATLEAAGLGSAAVEAEMLVEDATGLSRTETFAHPERAIDPALGDRVRDWARRRAAGEPLQYVTGWAGFYGRRFEVTPAVLIPRPETEVLVERALELWDAPERRGLPAVDVGTGSAVVAITLALERPGRAVHATEVSAAALAVARANAERLGAGVAFHEGDLFEPLAAVEPAPAPASGRAPAALRAFGLVASNPPYIPSAVLPALPPEVRDYEPRCALDGGPDGLVVIRRLLAAAAKILAPGGAIAVEIGELQGDAVLEIIRATSYYPAAHLHADLAGRPRVVTAETARLAR